MQIVNNIFTMFLFKGSVVMQLLGREQFILGQLVQKGELTDKTKSAFNLILQSTGSYSRYHPLLEDPDITYSDFTAVSDDKVFTEMHFFAMHDTESKDSKGLFVTANTLIVVFVPTSSGIDLAIEALLWLQETNEGLEDEGLKSRLALVVVRSPRIL